MGNGKGLNSGRLKILGEMIGATMDLGTFWEEIIQEHLERARLLTSRPIQYLTRLILRILRLTSVSVDAIGTYIYSE